MLNLDEMEKVQGGDATECSTALLFSAGAGAILGGGVGAVIGAAAAVTSSSCLGWW